MQQGNGWFPRPTIIDPSLLSSPSAYEHRPNSRSVFLPVERREGEQLSTRRDSIRTDINRLARTGDATTINPAPVLASAAAASASASAAIPISCSSSFRLTGLLQGQQPQPPASIFPSIFLVLTCFFFSRGNHSGRGAFPTSSPPSI